MLFKIIMAFVVYFVIAIDPAGFVCLAIAAGLAYLVKCGMED